MDLELEVKRKVERKFQKWDLLMQKRVETWRKNAFSARELERKVWAWLRIEL